MPQHMDVFPPGTTPRTFTPQQAAAVLREAAERIEAGDSMAGSILWGWSLDAPGQIDIGGLYRTGNQNGQGSVRILWET